MRLLRSEVGLEVSLRVYHVLLRLLALLVDLTHYLQFVRDVVPLDARLMCLRLAVCDGNGFEECLFLVFSNVLQLLKVMLVPTQSQVRYLIRMGGLIRQAALLETVVIDRVGPF